MQRKLNQSALKKHYQKHLGKMTHSFLQQALDQQPEKVLEIYESFCNEWVKTVNKINKRYEGYVLAHESWRNIWERDGYRNVITKPIAPEEKAAIIRVIYIVEQRTQKQRDRRELYYKFLWVAMRIKLYFKGIFKRSEDKKTLR